MTTSSIGRRQFLVGAAGFAVTSLVACSSGTRQVALPGTRPAPTRPEGTDLLPAVEHIIVVMMENHSYDNYFGVLGRGDGLPMRSDGTPAPALADDKGRLVRSFRLSSTCQLGGLPKQDWSSSHLSLGTNDNSGFARASGTVAMGYWTPQDLPFYASLAKTFPLCDRWFGSCLGQTYPNRRFLIAGTSAGLTETALSSINDPLPQNGLIFEQLDAHGISWANYYTDLPSIYVYATYATKHPANLLPIERFYADAAAGKLPAVTIVDPGFETGESEENPADIRRGEAFVARVTDAVMHGPGWAKTMMIWTYDEHGGYYDHVPPPAAVRPDTIAPRTSTGPTRYAFDRYGFRVPAVVVSPLARANYVSHAVHDHTSILKLIETKWNLPALTYRDAAADNLLDTLDLRGRPTFLEPPSLAKPALAGSATKCAKLTLPP